MSKPETPKRCGVCGSELQLNRVFAMPDSWVCVKAGCPAWRWDGEPVPSAPKRDCLCHCHACKQGCPCPEGGRCCPCLCSPEYGLPENHDERCPKYKPAQPAPVSEPPRLAFIPMSKLDARDRRRADALLREASRATTSPLIHPDRLRDHIAAALKRERDEGWDSAMIEVWKGKCIERGKRAARKAARASREAGKA